MKINEILENGFSMMGIEADSQKIDALMTYASLLVEWNGKMNLTAITEESDIAIKHFLDSASAFLTNKVGKKVIDVGTGAGFPGLVLKILNPQIEMTLLDSLNKRITFLDEVISKTDLTQVETVHSRAEDGGKNPKYREKFDTAVSRAVANLTLLSELCLPYVKVGGYFLALKGPAADEELIAAKKTISILGGEVEGVYDAEIPMLDASHKIIIIKKVRQTPIKYPRNPAKIAKSPVEQCYNIRKKAAK